MAKRMTSSRLAGEVRRFLVGEWSHLRTLKWQDLALQWPEQSIHQLRRVLTVLSKARVIEYRESDRKWAIIAWKTSCRLCGRPLVSTKSQDRGAGPVCWKILKTRQQLLGQQALLCATSHIDRNYQKRLCDPPVRRQPSRIGFSNDSTEQLNLCIEEVDGE